MKLTMNQTEKLMDDACKRIDELRAARDSLIKVAEKALRKLRGKNIMGEEINASICSELRETIKRAKLA